MGRIITVGGPAGPPRDIGGPPAGGIEGPGDRGGEEALSGGVARSRLKWSRSCTQLLST